MVSVQKIEGVYPIENADRIEKIRIGGWIVVVGKDMGLKPGDHVAYYEIDSMLPADDPRYTDLQKRGQRTVPVSNTYYRRRERNHRTRATYRATARSVQSRTSHAAFNDWRTGGHSHRH